MMTVVRDTRQTILGEAFDLFRKQGYAATTMGQVAEAVGISKGNLTYHFPSKQALFEAVNAFSATFVRERLIARSFDEAPEAIAGLEDFCRRIRRWAVDPDGHFVGCIFTNVAVETQHSDVAVGQMARNTLSGFSQALGERFAAAQAAGEIRGDQDAATLSRMFFWMYEGALTISRAMDSPIEYDAFRFTLRAWLTPA
ncbi:MAG: transcriptional regulator, TetR family [Cyanobacteria bacterium RYN_339]|nr:transcriptional regulator, TetR family [Cyanobacteria bacterium RYN_339]